ncbi:hypothetical protein H2200_006640 [Cladophialophora chaetospira]|uniref:DUF2428 domain-containing protein n=1 Tax=Cladophialophora chaetospira TaxID=386627 RepID=A0AA38X8S0_9EURO|nr:hypothetical protein H2200_006640 [Cladophialophora chaetospira]
MDPVSFALSEDLPLPISILSNLGKGSLRLALLGATNDEDVARILGLWPKLILTASSPQVNDKHITAASNALCVYIACGRSSTVTKLQQYVSSQKVWFEAFQCAHRAFNDGKTKPAFQIMETLCDLLQKPTMDSIPHQDTLEKASLPLVRTILLAAPRSEVKKACLVLSCMHRRMPLHEILDRLVSRCLQENDYAWRQRLTDHNISLSDLSTILKGSITQFFLALILAMVDLDTRSAALKLCSVLSGHAVQQPGAYDLQGVVERVIQLYLEKNNTAIGGYAENILPDILDNQTKLISFIQPYATSCRDDSSRMALFLAILKVGRAKAILSESETFDALNAAFPSPPTFNSQPDKIYWCKQLLMTGDSEVRILMYGLFVSSPAGNAVVSPEVLECISLAMKYLHDHADAHERGELLAITKRLLRRHQTGALAHGKSVKCREDHEGHGIVLRSYESFERSFYDFLKDELSTGISYPRHILSLNSLQHFFEFALNPGLFSTDRTLVAALINLVLDPFEDVRGNAATMLNMLASQYGDLVAGALSPAFLERVEAMALKTGRADHADAMGRLLCLQDTCLASLSKGPTGSKDDTFMEVILQLERLTSKDARIQLKPGCNLPIHGLLLRISYRLRSRHTKDDQLMALAPNVLNVCVNVWNQVRGQLCIDSPERAADIDDEINDEGPKDLLAFSWRALRDSSVVLQSLIAVIEPSQKLFQALGDLCMDQLISLRHRGAFSTVAQTFSLCCERVRSSIDGSMRDLIRDWYRVALTQIDAQADRLTRRSAGLPAMMTALLSPADPKLFSTVIADLITIAQRPVHHTTPNEGGQIKLAQVHALNCLKDIMTNARFAAAVAQYQALVMELAATCLSSKVWAIRNCGLMLLRACMNRLGTSGTGQTLDPIHQSEENGKTDTPSVIAFRLLDEARPLSEHDNHDTTSATEHVFAGLDLLAHVNPEGPKAAVAREIVLQHLANPTWAVRDRAALLLATHMSSGNPITEMLTLLEEGIGGQGNSTHGTLLCCRYLMERATTVMKEAELDSLCDTLVRKMTDPSGGFICLSPYVHASWLDLLTDAAALILDRWSSGFLKAHTVVERLRFTADTSRRHSHYFRQRILLFETYHLLMQDEQWLTGSKEMRYLISDFIENTDALSFTLDNLSQRDIHNAARAVIVFLAKLVDEACDQGPLPTHALEKVFICLNQGLSHLADAPVSTAQLLLDRIDFGRLHTPRELRNAAMELKASLLGIIHAARPQPENHQRQVEDWLSVVEDSVADDLDFPTRLAAATAVSTYTGRVTVSGLSEQPPRTRLRLLRTLYDLLNDDDEDVRAEAIQAARRLKLYTIGALDNLDYCALAAREEVLLKLKRQFLGDPGLTEAALLNVLRLGQLPNDLSRKGELLSLLSTSAASRLRGIAKTKNDLFAEERQNLYIDDIREIKAWTGLLEDNGHLSLGPELNGIAVQWTVEGLGQVIAVLETDQQKGLGHQVSNDLANKEISNLQAIDQDSLPGTLFGHPLGISYDHETLVVLIQIISLAGVFYRDKQTEGEGQIQNLLGKVKDLCSWLPVNPVLLGAVEHALKTK